MAEMHPLTQAIIDGDKAAATALTQGCLDEGEAAGDIIEQRLVPGMAVIGEQFQKDEIFVPEMLIAANAMSGAMDILQPLIAASGAEPLGVFLMGTVKGDIHDIGKNIVGSLFKAHGYKVVDVGKDVSDAAFIEAAEANNADVIAASALMSITRAGRSQPHQGHRRPPTVAGSVVFGFRSPNQSL